MQQNCVFSCETVTECVYCLPLSGLTFSPLVGLGKENEWVKVRMINAGTFS